MRHTERWDRHFLRQALENCSMSKDPNTQVGAVLVRDDIPISPGWNGFPRGLADTEARLQDRDIKMEMVICAERNAILNAARIGVSTLGASLFLVATDATGEVWGGMPKCMSWLHEAGVKYRQVSLKDEAFV